MPDADKWVNPIGKNDRGGETQKSDHQKQARDFHRHPRLPQDAQQALEGVQLKYQNLEGTRLATNTRQTGLWNLKGKRNLGCATFFSKGRMGYWNCANGIWVSHTTIVVAEGRCT